MEAKDLYEIYKKHPVVTTDSRDCPEGSIFIALKGASFDGNKFAAMALRKVAATPLSTRSEYAVDGDSRYILVDDTLVAFKELAREHRRQFNIPVIGITGTNGKTTTKSSSPPSSPRNTTSCTPRETSTTMSVCQRHCSGCVPSTRLPSWRWVPLIPVTSRSL